MWRDQRRVAAGHSGSVNLKALAASIVVHVIVLGSFGVVRFSDWGESQNDGIEAASVSLSSIKELSESPLVAPKPKVKHRDVTGSSLRAEKLLSAAAIAGRDEPGNAGSAESEIIISSETLPELSPQESLNGEIEFFGSVSEQRKVCYVVDCSGSMRGMFARVRRELTESIDKLWADQYFYIIFFGGGRFYETGGGKLVRATEKAKRRAYDFIESVRPAGQTNAMAALKRAMQIRDEQQRSAAVVYFLTDGFELTEEAGEEFLRQTLKMQKQFAPSTRINTIGFWPQSNDRILLERLSRQSGGESVFVGDGNI